MGMCESCCRKSSYEDVAESPESRRRNMLEAAEKRKKEQESRGLHNPERVKKKKMQMEEFERKQENMEKYQGETGLRVAAIDISSV